MSREGQNVGKPGQGTQSGWVATYSQAFGMILCSGAMQKYQPVGGQACQKRFL